MYLAIDPGIDTGWCTLDARGDILACGLGENFPTRSERAAIIERPQVYRGRLQKGDPNDLITLAIRVGRYTERLEVAGVRVGHVLPGAWKGQIDKDVHHARVVESLTTEQARTIAAGLQGVPKKKAHNVLDAVALALEAYRREIFPR